MYILLMLLNNTPHPERAAQQCSRRIRRQTRSSPILSHARSRRAGDCDAESCAARRVTTGCMTMRVLPVDHLYLQAHDASRYKILCSPPDRAIEGVSI